MNILLSTSIFLIIYICNASPPLRSITTTQEEKILQRNLVESKDSASQISPKVFIIDAFSSEAEAWYGIPEFDLLAQNISITGLSPLYPEVHCTADGEICQVVTGEGEINAATTTTALLTSQKFNLSTTFFLIAGIAGINPEYGTLGSVTFARYTVQVALQYEIFPLSLPPRIARKGGGYIPQGSHRPGQYPQSIYGTEVFEVNDNLRKVAAAFAEKAVLNDTLAAAEYRAKYGSADGNAGGNAGADSDKHNYTAATKPPGIVLCDSATSDVFFSGSILADAFSRYMHLVTNGSAVYCASAQEDSAILEALVRGARAKPPLVDFSRVILMRTGSDFDRPHAGQSDLDNLLNFMSVGFPIAIRNIYLAGVQVVMGIVEGWKDGGFEEGIRAENYVGDILDSLGGLQTYTPDFGLARYYLSASSGSEKSL